MRGVAEDCQFQNHGEFLAKIPSKVPRLQIASKMQTAKSVNATPNPPARTTRAKTTPTFFSAEDLRGSVPPDRPDPPPRAEPRLSPPPLSALGGPRSPGNGCDETPSPATPGGRAGCSVAAPRLLFRLLPAVPAPARVTVAVITTAVLPSSLVAEDFRRAGH